MHSRRAAAAASLVVAALLAGCTAGTGPVDGDALDDDGPVLYLNVTANGQTHRFSSDQLPGAGGDGDDGDGADVDANATSSSGTVTAQGNATAGNGTAQGNGTASNGTGSAQGSAGGPDGTSGGFPSGMPGGEAPLDVVVEIGASGLPDPTDGVLNWTVHWGEAAGTSGGNGSAQGYANGTAAAQKAQESGSQLPMRLQHTYSTEGRHDLRFVLEAAGQGLGALDTVITVVSAGVEPGTVLGQMPFNATGELPLSSPLQGCDAEGGEEVPWEFLPEVNGTPANVSELSLALDSGSGIHDADLHLFAPNGTLIGSSANEGEPDEALELSGAFPPGQYVVHVVGCLGTGGDFALDGLATYVATGAATNRTA